MRVLTSSALWILAAAAQASTPANTPSVPKGVYTLDKAHTSLIFRVNHLGFSTFTGRFTGVDARLETDPSKLSASKLDVTIDPASIASDNAPDGFLAMVAGKGWLDAQDFPTMHYRSTKVEVIGANKVRIDGELTFHGVTKPVVLEAKYNGGYAGHPMDPHARIGFSATGRFKRSDFGVTVGVPAPGTTMGVGDEVEVVLETELSGPALAKN
ncbi:MAG: YceI family protein [Pseudomonadota bacterium]